MRNKKIAILTNNDDDIYCFRLELIQKFIAEGYDVLISCPYGPKFDLLKDIDYEYDNPNIDRRGTNIINDFKLLCHYYFLLKNSKPDIILTYTAKPNVYASMAAHLLKIPYINNVTGLGSVINKTGLSKKLIMSLFKYVYQRAYCVMFQNDTNMKLAIDLGWIKGDYKLIPGSGVALNRFNILEYPDGGNGNDGEKVVFNYIGRVLKDKGIDDYIEVAKRVKQNYTNTEFNIIGFIEPTELEYEKIFDDLEKKNIIKYRGSQKDVVPFIKMSHAIIHPSMYGEGMSNVLLENASSARPIITTNNPGCRETVDDNNTGFIYQGHNIEELYKKIEIFLSMDNEQRKIMGLNGRKKIESSFSREIVVDAYLEKIRKCLK